MSLINFGSVNGENLQKNEENRQFCINLIKMGFQ